MFITKIPIKENKLFYCYQLKKPKSKYRFDWDFCLDSSKTPTDFNGIRI